MKYKNCNMRINYKALGESMYAWRKKHGFSQRDCEALVDLSSGGTTWGRIERARIKNEVRDDLLMGNFMKIVNLMHEDDSPQVIMRYFELL